MGLCLAVDNEDNSEKQNSDNLYVPSVPDPQLVTFYRERRRLIQCSMTNNTEIDEQKESNSNNMNTKNTHDNKQSPIIISVMTYNILARTYALEHMHSYCDIKYREWGFRLPRILAQLQAFEYPDVICMQEITVYTYETFFKPIMTDLGYIGIYGQRHSTSNSKIIQDDCLWIKKSTVDVIKYQIMRLGNGPMNKHGNNVNDKRLNFESLLAFGKAEELQLRRNSPFVQQLQTMKDVFIVAHCIHRESNEEFIACSTHLHWNPRNPHLKFGQTYLFNHRLYELITEQWKLNVDEIPIVIGMDANSLPYKSYTDQFDRILPKCGYLVSGMYTLMTEGQLSTEHSDHPRQRQANSFMQNETENIWRIPFNFRWRSVYKTAAEMNHNLLIKKVTCSNIDSIGNDDHTQISPLMNNGEPHWTTSVPIFKGCLDYIFINDQWTVQSYLEMPWMNELRFHHPCMNGRLKGNEINEEIELDEKIAGEFGSLPNEFYPSDHLLLYTTLVMHKQSKI